MSSPVTSAAAITLPSIDPGLPPSTVVGLTERSRVPFRAALPLMIQIPGVTRSAHDDFAEAVVVEVGGRQRRSELVARSADDGVLRPRCGHRGGARREDVDDAAARHGIGRRNHQVPRRRPLGIEDVAGRGLRAEHVPVAGAGEYRIRGGQTDVTRVRRSSVDDVNAPQQSGTSGRAAVSRRSRRLSRVLTAPLIPSIARRWRRPRAHAMFLVGVAAGKVDVLRAC